MSQKESHTHHHWHGIGLTLKYLLLWLLVFICLSVSLRIIESEISRKQDMYENCLDVCNDGPSAVLSINTDIIVTASGRDDCVRECNLFYYKIS